jgi:hypothetical protein
MKKILFLCLAVSLISLSCIALNQGSQAKGVESIDFSKYCGKTIREVLSEPALKNYSDATWIDEPPGMLSSVIIDLEEGLLLEIFPADINNQSSFSPYKEWSFDKFIEEEYKGNIIWDGRKKINDHTCL